MKITDVKPMMMTYGPRGMFLVKIETDAGLCGWGEGGISGRELGMAALVESFKPQLIGQDPRRIDRLWQVLFRGGFFESGTVMSGAISAVDIALWDLLGKHLKTPCWQLLGGRSRDRVECYTHTGLSTVRERAAEGWRYLRLGAEAAAGKPNEFDPDLAVRDVIQTMTKAREAVGEGVKLCIDFHQRFSPAQAAQACNGIAGMRPFFVEDPLRSVSPKSYVAFRQRTSVPLAVGEACSSKWEFQELIEEDAIDYVRIDVCNVGGLTEARKVAAMAETHYMDAIPHCPIGPVCCAASVHLALAIPNFAVLEYVFGQDKAPGVFTSALKFNGTFFEVPDAPGLGLEVDESKLAEYPWKPWLPPLWQRPDGAFTNW
ncbi:MAG: mandelate racemase/muconate lactonizing enzyme family protein [Planctomycetota bacterium]